MTFAWGRITAKSKNRSATCLFQTKNQMTLLRMRFAFIMATMRLARRSFSLTSVSSDVVKAPIQVFGIEGRYAHATYSAAARNKKLEEVEKELQSLKTLIGAHPDVSQYLKNPVIKKIEKQATLQELLKAEKCSSITVNLFGCLAENNRLSKAIGVIGAYEKLMSAHRGEVECTVTSAKSLTSDNLKSLQESLRGFIEKGQTLKMNTKTDPSLIGGMIVEIGDKRIDMSIFSKIKQLTGLLREAI
ncbi:ATP synthase subunit O, mitochondrial-like [Oscarella lobularis]|uniref:ATP synthase subunit O, mitochondrial-like n=1 Tax=Oscarella lobularis TaxID=121494 RepID=UPI00331419CD